MVELPAPESAGSSGRAFDSSRTAILLINFQNEFAKPGGKLHDGVDGVTSVMEHTGMLQKVPHVVRAAR
jgi:nicotinamidase-related amidase